MRKFAALAFLLLISPFFTAPAFSQMPMPDANDDELGIESEKQLTEEGEKKAEQKEKEIPPIKMVFIKGGCFEMGDFIGDGDDDESPVHEVCVGDFYLQEAEVTQELWESVMKYNLAKDKDPQKPAVYISWVSANNFLQRLNEAKKGFYRLPTEAEWEYAARSGGLKERWPGVSNEGSLGDYAWFTDTSQGELKQVKQKKPNGLGLYDMGGSVWEWVEDYFDFDYYKDSPKKDPYGPDMSLWRTVRGGSFIDEPFKTRTTYRYAIEAPRRLFNVGFRLAE